VEYIQGTLFYTEADMVEARETQRTQFTAGTEYGARATKNDLNTKAIEYFRNEVREGSMDKDDALGIYNGLAEALGWTTLDSITTKFTVTVSYNGNIIAEFSGIEADDADSAEEEVSSNISVDDVELSISLSYNGDSATESVNVSYDWDEDFEYSASEE
jgi:hypothetical protein